MDKILLSLNGISRSYPGFSLQHVSLQIGDGEYFVLLGRSGSGKSILLELIAGIRRTDSGQILLKNTDITHKPVQKRSAILMHQGANLFPHMSVFDNICFPLRCRRLPRKGRNDRVMELAHTVSVSHLLHRYPSGLSGGEAQRVALARALAIKPAILLLDEPLAALDVLLHAELKSLLHTINNQGQTILHVTHHYDEAKSLADRLAVIDQGKIIQTGTSEELEYAPKNNFVARLAGINNFFQIDHAERLKGTTLSQICLSTDDLRVIAVNENQVDKGYLVINDAEIILSRKPAPGEPANHFAGIVTEVVPGPADFCVRVDIGILLAVSVKKEVFRYGPYHTGDQVWISFPPDACRLVAI